MSTTAAGLALLTLIAQMESTESTNGLLVEAGLDYTTFNFSDTSVGMFVRGGPVFWGSDLGTSWRAWGGLSLKF